MARNAFCSIIVLLALAGCDSEPKFALSPATMNCSHDSCLVAFSITNTSQSMLPLVYDVSLVQNYVRDPSQSGVAIVGSADGEVKAPPGETTHLEVEVPVSEKPNGSKVRVFDARTPDVIKELLDIPPI